MSPPLPHVYIRNKNWNKNKIGIKMKARFSRNASSVRQVEESRYSVIVAEVIDVGSLANSHIIIIYLGLI